MTSSRIDADEKLVVVTTPGEHVDAGTRFRVLELDEPREREPTPEEIASCRSTGAPPPLNWGLTADWRHPKRKNGRVESGHE